MKALPTPSSPTALLSFDFDGTLHHSAGDPPVPAAFFEMIRRLREEKGVIWGINTGRALPFMLEGFIESQFPFLPDWIVAREREIYFSNPIGQWLPHPEWNDRCEREIDNLFRQSRNLLLEIRQLVEDHTRAQWIEMDGEPAGIISKTEEEMEWIVDRIEPLVVGEAHLTWQRNSIYLRFGHRGFQKGTSLVHLAKHYSIEPANRFAIGDSHNDIEMLDPTHVGMIACPANAVDAIKHRIKSNGGLVTQASHGHGSIEALQHYFLTPKASA
jgi:HAD superfamily hydrolase (TIGR01484 family)